MSRGKHSKLLSVTRYRRPIAEPSLLANIRGLGIGLEKEDVKALGLAAGTVKKLRATKIYSVQDLINCTEGDLIYIPHIGIGTLENVKNKLNRYLHTVSSESKSCSELGCQYPKKQK